MTRADDMCKQGGGGAGLYHRLSIHILWAAMYRLEHDSSHSIVSRGCQTWFRLSSFPSGCPYPSKNSSGRDRAHTRAPNAFLLPATSPSLRYGPLEITTSNHRELLDVQQRMLWGHVIVNQTDRTLCQHRLGHYIPTRIERSYADKSPETTFTRHEGTLPRAGFPRIVRSQAWLMVHCDPGHALRYAHCETRR